MRRHSVFLLGLLLFPALANAQAVDESYLELLQWRSIGPSRGGRVVAVAGDTVDKMVVIVDQALRAYAT
jgi:hypothetical protein